MNTKLRIPPQNIDAEKALLGSILIKSDSIFDVLELVNENSFYSDKHKIIFKAMMDLFQKNEPIDLLTLSAILKNKKELDAIGGESYLAELSAIVPSAANIDYYTKIVSEKAVKRHLIQASEKINELGYDEEEDSEISIDKAEKEIFEVSKHIGSSEFFEISSSLKDSYERLERLQEGGDKIRGVPTGFKALDYKLSGFQPSDLIILAARPSVGKTSLSLDIARKIAINEKKTIAFFSLEMSKEQLTDRMLSAEAQVDA